ncbi:MAG: carboxypeptidase regulatory-like domain-containing protein [Myxococcales bacterium]|nr:carboxypeptidase regulatory-like domain-containing protein [Myxococcales bacterium]
MARRSHTAVVRRPARVWIAGTLLVLVSSMTTRAQPTVHVHAATRIELHSSRGATGVRIRGVLLDDLDGPVANAAIDLRVTPQEGDGVTDRRTLRTTADGTFRVELPLELGSYRARATFAGEGHHGGSAAEHVIDLTRADVRLTFLEPRDRRVNLDEPLAALALRASSAEGGARISLIVADELGRQVAAGTTDAAGLLHIEVASEDLGPASMGRLVARSEGDGLRTAARAEIPLLRMRPTRLSLRQRTDDNVDALVLEGELRTSNEALARRAVGLFDGERHLATVLTDAEGRFAYRDLARGAPTEQDVLLDVQARFESDAPWFGESRSEALAVTLRGARPPTGLWLLVPVLLCAGLLWWLSARAPEPASERRSQPRRAVRIGIEAGTVRRGRPSRREIGGRVVSADHGRAVARAQVELIAEGGGTVITARSDDDGAFMLGPVDDGPWTLRIVADGHAPTAQHVHVPHRGEWSALVARLQNLRSAALRAFEPVAEAVLGAPGSMQTTTPREVVTRASERGRAPKRLRMLVRRVEHVVFGRAHPIQDDVDAITRDAARVEDEARRRERPTP